MPYLILMQFSNALAGDCLFPEVRFNSASLFIQDSRDRTLGLLFSKVSGNDCLFPQAPLVTWFIINKTTRPENICPSMAPATVYCNMFLYLQLDLFILTLSVMYSLHLSHVTYR